MTGILKIQKLILLTVILLIYTTHLFAEKEPLTVAESSNYQSTSTYQDVMNFIHFLQERHTNIRVENICRTTEGREVPMMILADPMPASPLELKEDERVVLYFQANIHAGEVEGKEAVLMLARDILSGKTAGYLEDLIILITPDFNADGNEKISTENRKRQHGPVNGVGVRYNGQKLDLNRDGIKLESPEVRGMVKNVLNRWDPHLFVDCHTTNGSYHEEPLTYTWGVNPNGDRAVIDYVSQKLLPFVQKNLKDKHRYLSIPYGNFMDFKDPEKGWAMAGPECRYLTNYVGLRNRISILNENYSYAEYETRVKACYGFLHSIMEFCAKNKKEVNRLIRQSDQRSVKRGMAPQTTDLFHVEYDLKPFHEPVKILGWEMEYLPDARTWPPLKILDKKKTYTIPYYCEYEPNRSIAFAYGYFIDMADPAIAEKLLQHGILVEKLNRPVTVQVEFFQLTELKSRENAFQGHHLNQVQGEYKTVEKTFPEGTWFVPTGQKLGSLAAYLLEPESEDGLLVWNFFDLHLRTQWRNHLLPPPVYRLLHPVPMARVKVDLMK